MLSLDHLLTAPLGPLSRQPPPTLGGGLLQWEPLVLHSLKVASIHIQPAGRSFLSLQLVISTILLLVGPVRLAASRGSFPA